jgi:hypothetical protein
MHRRTKRSPGRLQRHSRNAILAALAAVLCSLGGFAAFAATQGAWLRDPLYADKADRFVERIAAKKRYGERPLSVVMLGSSRASNALRGTDLETQFESVLGRPVVAFNFGIPSSGPVTQMLHLRRLLAAGQKPDLVLFEILPKMLSNLTGESIEHNFYDSERLLPGEAAFVHAHGYPWEKFRNGEWLATWIPIHGMRLPILGRYLPKWSPWNRRFDSSRNCDETGWMRPVNDNVTREQREQGVAAARADYEPWLQELPLNGAAAAAVHESLAICRSANVRIALVLMPEGTQFRALYSQSALAEMTRFLATCEGAPVIDARLWLPDEAFSDSHHMNSFGAREFTARLGEFLLTHQLLPSRP